MSGEKERGTLETLLTLPVTNFQMIMSKFISVSIVACVTAIISLLAFGGSILFLMLAVPEDMTSEMTQFPVETILSSIPILLFALITTTLFVTAFSILTIWILAKMYDSEDIMFSDGFRSFRLFQKRSDIKKGTIPATGDVIICLVVTFLLMVYAGGIFSARDTFIGTIVTQLLVLATPLLLTWYMKSDKKELFSLKKPKLSILPGSILLYIGTYLLVLVVFI